MTPLLAGKDADCRPTDAVRIQPPRPSISSNSAVIFPRPVQDTALFDCSFLLIERK